MGTKSLNRDFMTGIIFSTFTANQRMFGCIYLLSLCSDGQSGDHVYPLFNVC